MVEQDDFLQRNRNEAINGFAAEFMMNSALLQACRYFTGARYSIRRIDPVLDRIRMVSVEI